MVASFDGNIEFVEKIYIPSIGTGFAVGIIPYLWLSAFPRPNSFSNNPPLDAGAADSICGAAGEASIWG